VSLGVSRAGVIVPNVALAAAFRSQIGARDGITKSCCGRIVVRSERSLAANEATSLDSGIAGPDLGSVTRPRRAAFPVAGRARYLYNRLFAPQGRSSVVEQRPFKLAGITAGDCNTLQCAETESLASLTCRTESHKNAAS
jgi:hypothetical protein